MYPIYTKIIMVSKEWWVALMVCTSNGIIVFGHFGDKAWETGVPELALEIHWDYNSSFGLLAMQFWAYEGIEGFKHLDQNQFNE